MYVISRDSQTMWMGQGQAQVQFGPTFARYNKNLLKKKKRECVLKIIIRKIKTQCIKFVLRSRFLTISVAPAGSELHVL